MSEIRARPGGRLKNDVARLTRLGWGCVLPGSRVWCACHACGRQMQVHALLQRRCWLTLATALPAPQLIMLTAVARPHPSAHALSVTALSHCKSNRTIHPLKVSLLPLRTIHPLKVSLLPLLPPLLLPSPFHSPSVRLDHLQQVRYPQTGAWHGMAWRTGL